MHFLSQNRPDRAAEALRDALASDPSDAGVHAMLAGCLIDLDKPREAVRHAKEAVRLDPESAYHHRILAASLAARGQLGGAHDAAQRARQLDPQDADVAALLANLFNFSRQPSRAMAEAWRGLSLDPQHLGCREALAAAYHNRGKPGDLERAEAIVREMLAINPERRFAHRIGGLNALRRNDAIAAERHLSESLRIDPEAVDAAEVDDYQQALLLSFPPYRWMQALTLPRNRGKRVVVQGVLCLLVAIIASILLLIDLTGLTLIAFIVVATALAVIPRLAAEAWVRLRRPEARVLGVAARVRFGVIIGGIATALAAAISLAALGPTRAAVVAPAVVAFAMPLWFGWTLRRERPTAAWLWPAFVGLVGVIGVTWLLLRTPPDEGGHPGSGPEMLTVLYFCFALASYGLPYWLDELDQWRR